LGTKTNKKRRKWKRWAILTPAKKTGCVIFRGLPALLVKVLKWSWKHLNACLFKSINWDITSVILSWQKFIVVSSLFYTPTLAITLSVRPSVHTFVTDISASTGRNDFIFDIRIWHGDLYRVSPFQVYRTSTFCLPCDLQMNEWGVFLARRSCNILFYIGINFPFITHSCDSYWDKQYNLYEKAFYWY
jgi:hypothetical protein